jgi:hypothetical protein
LLTSCGPRAMTWAGMPSGTLSAEMPANQGKREGGRTARCRWSKCST